MSKFDKFKDESTVLRGFNINDFKATDDEYNIQGHSAVFDQVTSIGGYFDEVIERGAFDECDFSDVSLFINHNMDMIPLARARGLNSDSTLKLEVDDKGLFIRAKLDIENNSEAKTLYSSIKRGDIDGMSFAFIIKKQTWENLDKEIPLRRIQKISKVFEVSAVNNPAYTDTDISARDKRALEKEKKNIRSKDDKNELELLRLKFLGGIY